MMNVSATKTDPCGTPQTKSSLDDFIFATCINCFLF